PVISALRPVKFRSTRRPSGLPLAFLLRKAKPPLGRLFQASSRATPPSIDRQALGDKLRPPDRARPLAHDAQRNGLRALSDSQQITAEAYIRRLAARGIEYVFANAGTDFAPIIEAITRNAGGDQKIPKFITVPHENVAMAMAHGYY